MSRTYLVVLTAACLCAIVRRFLKAEGGGRLLLAEIAVLVAVTRPKTVCSLLPIIEKNRTSIGACQDFVYKHNNTV